MTRLGRAILLALAAVCAAPVAAPVVALAQPVWPPPPGWRPHPHWRRPWARPVYGAPGYAYGPGYGYAPGYAYAAPLYPIAPQPYEGADGVGAHPH